MDEGENGFCNTEDWRRKQYLLQTFLVREIPSFLLVYLWPDSFGVRVSPEHPQKLETGPSRSLPYMNKHFKDPKFLQVSYLNVPLLPLNSTWKRSVKVGFCFNFVAESVSFLLSDGQLLQSSKWSWGMSSLLILRTFKINTREGNQQKLNC